MKHPHAKNKVAVLQGVIVLNINELANALKPVFLPGENLQVQIYLCRDRDTQWLHVLTPWIRIVLQSNEAGKAGGG